MKLDIVTLVVWTPILAVLLAADAGRTAVPPADEFAPPRADQPRLHGCGPRPVPADLERPSFEEARAGSDVVFAGLLLDTDDPVPLSMEVPEEDLVLDHVFEVYRLWGGEPAETLRVRSYRDPASGGYGFRVGEAYLVYAVREDGRLWTNRCTRTGPVTAAYTDLYRLGEPAFDSPGSRLPALDPESLARGLRSPERAVRIQTLRVMEQIALEDSAVVFLMIEGMGGHSNTARVDFLAALGRTGSAGAPAVPVLLETLAGENATLRAMAATSLARIAGQSEDALPEAVPALVAALRDEDVSVRATAAQALGSLGAAAAEAAPALREALTDPEPRVRDRASNALQLIGAATR